MSRRRATRDASRSSSCANVSKTFGEVRSLSDVNFKVYPRRDRRPARRQRRRQIDAGEDRHGLPPARSPAARSTSTASASTTGRWRAPAASASRPSIRNGRSARSSRSGATCSWAASRAPNGACSTSSACSEEFGPPDERAYGLHLGGGASRQRRDDHVGRREAGRRHHPRAALRCAAGHPRRADDGAFASPRRRRRWSSSTTSRRPASRRSSSITTSSTSIRWSTASMCSTAARSPGVYDKTEISMDELIDRLYRVARSGSLE